MHPHSHSHVLQLDIQGTPQAWISLEHAATHMATGSVAWVDGDGPLATLRGGFNVARGRQSVMDVHPIVALHGASRVNLFDVVPPFSKGKLFRRDRFTCAYCGEHFAERDLQCEHIVPASRGGLWTWMNLVTATATAARPLARRKKPACRSCTCRTCRAASKAFCSKADTSAPTCTSGWLRACRKDHASAEASQESTSRCPSGERATSCDGRAP